jgi:predicted amidophosphoribosyltransferase
MADEPPKIDLGDTTMTAIERAPGQRSFRRNKDRHRPLTQCENCGAHLTGYYCAQCGRAAVITAAPSATLSSMLLIHS